MIDNYGADAARPFVMFASPPEQTIEWSCAGVEGTLRYLRRVWNFAAAVAPVVKAAGEVNHVSLDAAAKKLRHEIHSTLRQANYDYSRLQYNTVVSACMKLLNTLEDHRAGHPAVVREGLSILLRVLYPACPHVTHELWEQLGFAVKSGGLLDAPWPESDPAALEQDEIELVLQVTANCAAAYAYRRPPAAKRSRNSPGRRRRQTAYGRKTGEEDDCGSRKADQCRRLGAPPARRSRRCCWRPAAFTCAASTTCRLPA
jgi:leucyl-tRNA synthetase